MPKKAKELSALEVKRLVEPGMHAVGTVPGLHLQVLPSGGRTWVLRVTVGDQPGSAKQRRREVGLGGYPEVTLAIAHEKARAMRDKLKAGIDPVAERQAARSALRAAAAAAITFEEAAKQYIAAHESGWRNEKHGDQWRNTLRVHAEPILGKLIVSHIQVAHVLKVLEPIWQEKTETATRVRGRIEKILDWAKGRGYRSGDNPAAWKGNLQAQLPQPKAIAKVEHHAALPFNQIGAFMTRLRGQEGMGARALEFTTLTAARSGEVRGATWAEIDLEAAVWTVPGERMKMGKEHRVPLSPAAVALLKRLPRREGVDKSVDYVFPAPRGGRLSDMTLTAVLRRMEVPATVHGMRSTFRDWAAEHTEYPREVAEMALAHSISNAVEAAYRRGDLFAKRIALMEDWAEFCGTSQLQ
jgi:integrase